VITLAIDASVYTGSVCVARRETIVAARDVAMRDARGDRLMPGVAEALAEAKLDLSDVDRIVCGGGPGSFTSLRIASAIAKGLAMSTRKPLYAVSSLALMVGAAQPPLPPGEYIATLDALRGEYYVASYSVGGSGNVVDVAPFGVANAAEIETLERSGRAVIGELRQIRGVPNARGVVRVETLLERDGPVDLALWEPDYGRVAEAQRRWEAAHGRAMPRA
jgi:tRNA threonylcarbamoyladenosine biosynthesis protein TsaB